MEFTPSLSRVHSHQYLGQERLERLSPLELLTMSQAGDQEATHCLILRYRSLIEARACRLAADPQEAADLTSEAYVHIFAVLNTCRNVETLPGWIRRITTNIFYKMYRDQKRRRETSLEGLISKVGDLISPRTDHDPAQEVLDAFRLGERRQRMCDALRSLPEFYRVMLEMFYIKNLPYAEIASQTGLSLGTVKSRLSRARDILRRKLGDLIA